MECAQLCFENIDVQEDQKAELGKAISEHFSNIKHSRTNYSKLESFISAKA
jgi:hypothetical protein